MEIAIASAENNQSKERGVGALTYSSQPGDLEIRRAGWGTQAGKERMERSDPFAINGLYGAGDSSAGGGGGRMRRERKDDEVGNEDGLSVILVALRAKPELPVWEWFVSALLGWNNFKYAFLYKETTRSAILVLEEIVEGHPIIQANMTCSEDYTDNSSQQIHTVTYIKRILVFF